MKEWGLIDLVEDMYSNPNIPTEDEISYTMRSNYSEEEVKKKIMDQWLLHDGNFDVEMIRISRRFGTVTLKRVQKEYIKQPIGKTSY